MYVRIAPDMYAACCIICFFVKLARFGKQSPACFVQVMALAAFADDAYQLGGVGHVQLHGRFAKHFVKQYFEAFGRAGAFSENYPIPCSML